MSRKNKNDNGFSDGLVKFFIGLMCLIPFSCGMLWGLKSAFFVIPAVTVIVVAVNYFTTKKFDLSENFNVIIGLAIFIFVLIFLGSCFHYEDKDPTQRYIDRRVNMGLPMY